jgi:hypothetical protein
VPRRAYCKGQHDFQYSHGRNRLLCTRCPASFPCREACAHIDCEEEKGYIVNCPICRKAVRYEDGFHFSVGEHMVRVHEGCAERYRRDYYTDPSNRRSSG